MDTVLTSVGFDHYGVSGTGGAQHGPSTLKPQPSQVVRNTISPEWSEYYVFPVGSTPKPETMNPQP